jgi:putative Mg2+ transporter-C (MgtC) family protein
VTGVGFIGAGLLFRQSDQQIGIVHGVTTAAAILAAAAIGAAAGQGQIMVAVIATVLVLLSLELRYIPFVRVLDARLWSSRFRSDDDPHHKLIAPDSAGHVPGPRDPLPATDPAHEARHGSAGRD